MSSPKRKKLNGEEWAEIRALLDSLDQFTPKERAEFYVKNGIKKTIRQEVEKFLKHQTAVDRFLEAPLPKVIAQQEGIALECYAGDVIQGFKLVKEIGRGSFATVFLAEELSLGRRVALKISRGSPHEAKLLASLEHDHIVRVFSEKYEEKARLRLVCMQLVPGASMEQIISKTSETPTDQLNGEAILQVAEKLSSTTPDFNSTSLAERNVLSNLDYVESILFIGSRIASALDYAHSRSVLHLDVKPSNVLLTPYGRPLLADFNVSISGEAKDSLQEEFGGTLEYMSPEQKKVFEFPNDPEVRKGVGPCSDIYSLGVVLKEWLAIAKAKGIREASNEEIRCVLDKAMAQRPQDRFTTAAEMSQALRACLDVIKLKKAMPPANWIIQFSEKHPMLGLTLIGAAPQLTASLVGIYYNRLRIISHLSTDQRALFDFLNLYINPIIFTGASIIWVLLVTNALARLNDSRKQRERLLRLPYQGFMVTTSCWLPVAVLYAICLQNRGNGLTLQTLIHLFLSFGHSWVIAASYSYLFHSWIVIRSLYPNAFAGETDVGTIAEEELQSNKVWSVRALRFVILIPLIGAALFLGFGEDLLDAVQFQSYRYLGVLLIALSGFGVFIASSLGIELQRIFVSFSRLKK